MKQEREKKQTRKKRPLKYLAIACCILTLLALAIGTIASRFINKQYLVGEIEKSINSQVVIGDVKLSLLSLPAKLTLSNVHLTPKEGNKADEKTGIQIEKLSLSVGLWALLKQHINVTDITLQGAVITTIYREDGSNTLDELFQSPEKKKNNKPAAKNKPNKKTEPQKIKKTGGLNVFDQQDFIATLGGLSIIDSRIDITLERAALRLHCTDLNINLSSIKIDPNKLKETNTAKLKLKTKLRIDTTKGIHYGDIFITGKATARIFNPETGNSEPNVDGEFNLGDNSRINTHIPVVTKAWGYLSVLEKIGIKIAPLPEKATFGRSQAIAAHYHLNRITVRKPISIWVGDWELAAMENSWMDTATDQHELHGELLASQSASTRFHSIINTGAVIIPEKFRVSVLEDINNKLFQDKRLIVKIKSSGEFSDPKIRPVGAIPDFAKSAKEAGQELLKNKASGLLESLLRRDKD